MRQALGPGALGRPGGSGWRGRWEGGSGWGRHVKKKKKKKELCEEQLTKRLHRRQVGLNTPKVVFVYKKEK